jgi:DNA-binding PadR family transcriptional regulator
MGNRFASETELAILRILRDHPGGLYGLEIVRASRENLSRGTVYTTLGRMEEKGFVRSRVRRDEEHAGLPRPRYTVAALGERALEAAEIMRLVPAGA